MTLNLDEIEQRAQAAAQLAEQATAGPWEAKWDWVACKLQDRDIPVLSGERSTADVRFAAAARTDVPALAADVAALVAEVKRLTAQVDDLTVAYNASMGILGKSLLGDEFQMPPFKPGGE